MSTNEVGSGSPIHDVPYAEVYYDNRFHIVALSGLSAEQLDDIAKEFGPVMRAFRMDQQGLAHFDTEAYFATAPKWWPTAWMDVGPHEDFGSITQARAFLILAWVFNNAAMWHFKNDARKAAEVGRAAAARYLQSAKALMAPAENRLTQRAQ